MSVRHTYRFTRPLTEAEAGELLHAIIWRDGSSIERDPTGAVIGCTAHPDDVATFLMEQRRTKRDGADRLKADLIPQTTRPAPAAATREPR